ncbi:MAG: Transcriptional regulatory protein ZraR [Syntrophorhabdaceae bacterium PtaU1.Bin034]|jgi:two-component system response regulator FlrC|nr:MAG: Transcriptional regulatory protein ZraR [Syntrophorhabdaceae bacterium PtaU1.Bin034]
MKNILVVDDDYHMRLALSEALMNAGYGVCSAEDGRMAVESIKTAEYDLVITDVKMPYINGMDLLGRIKKEQCSLPVIVMTAYATVEHAVNAIKEGAFDYIQKPFDTDTLYEVVQRALGLESENIVCVSRAMKDVLVKAQQVARSEATVLVMGESGVGKELISRYIHENGERREMPFVAVNCAALPENLLESELFGYEKGAFTGATARKPGKFEIADKGTILLDEITEMDLRLQAKLLRVLQEKEVEAIGAKYPKKVDVKVIATTNRNIKKAVEEGKFREDLYYRLNVFPIVVPPLRQRREDIPQLTAHLLKKCARGMDIRMDKEAMNYLIQKNWRGNVRELENTVARACILSNYSQIKLAHVQDPPDEGEPRTVTLPEGEAVGSVKEMEMKLILDALKSMNGNRTRAATVLGITSRTLRNKIKEYRELGYAVP